MKFIFNLTQRFYDKILITIGVLGVLIPVSPWNMPVTYRDSGVFLYLGWRILNGEIPYKDIWDHKPPIIFYINALGLAISDESRWGVWIIEAIGLFISAYLGYLIIKKILGELPAIFSLVMWLLALVFVIQGGNLTTEYALPIQFTIFWLILNLEKKDNQNRYWFCIGLFTGFLFFLKQSTIGIAIAFVFYILVRAIKLNLKKQLLRELLLILLGFICISGAIFLYFYFNDALPQFWSAAFIYNFVFTTHAEFIIRLKAIITGIAPLTTTGFFQFALIGYVIAFLWMKKKKWAFDNWSSVFWVCLIDLPIEFLLVFAGGKTLGHYYMCMLPALCILLSLTFYFILEGLSHISITTKQSIIFTGISILIIFWSSFSDYYHQIISYREYGDPSISEYIKSKTDANDYVLIWGSDTASNYFSKRPSPSRFVYQYPLYKLGYTDESMIVEYLDSIIIHQPRLIIDTKVPSMPIFDFPIHTHAIQSNIEEIKSHYDVKDEFESWTVYEYTPVKTN